MIKIFCNRCGEDLENSKIRDWVQVKVFEPYEKELWVGNEYRLHFHRECWKELGYGFYTIHPWIKPKENNSCT